MRFFALLVLLGVLLPVRTALAADESFPPLQKIPMGRTVSSTGGRYAVSFPRGLGAVSGGAVWIPTVIDGRPKKVMAILEVGDTVRLEFSTHHPEEVYEGLKNSVAKGFMTLSSASSSRRVNFPVNPKLRPSARPFGTKASPRSATGSWRAPVARADSTPVHRTSTAAAPRPRAFPRLMSGLLGRPH